MRPSHLSEWRTYSVVLVGIMLFVLVVGCESEPGQSLSKDTKMQFQKAEYAYRSGAYRVALQLADSIQAAAPKFAGVYVLRGRVYTALERYEDASDELSRAAELDPENPAIHFNWATNAYRREQYNEALRRFETVLETMEGRDRVNIYINDEDGQEARYATLLQMGRAYDDLGKADSAMIRFEQAIETAPDNPEAYHATSELLERLGRFEEANDYARKALERKAENIEYKYALGLLLTQTGRYEEAVPYLRSMANERPWHHGSHYNLGQAYMQMGQQEKAESFLAEADSLQEAHSELEEMGKHAEDNTGNLKLWVQYGNALRQAGRLEDAKKAYRHALSLRPRNIALQNNLAILASETGNTQEAIMRYRAILRQNPQLPDVWLNLGVAYANSDRVPKARKAWQKALEHDPNHREAKEYLAQYN